MIYDPSWGGPTNEKAGADTNDTGPLHPPQPRHTQPGLPDTSAPWLTSSSQVDWYAVWLYFQRIVEGLGVLGFPAAGTIAWDALEDNDPRKLAAALAYAPHWALRIETAQGVLIAAFHDVSVALDWVRVARRIKDHREFYEAHPWLRRAS